MASALFVFLSILSGSMARNDSRAPHGLHNEKPVAMSPLAHDFFHPKVHTHTQPGDEDPCDESTECSPIPLASTVPSTLARENKSQPNSSHIGLAGTAMGFMFVLLVGTGVYFVTVKRRANRRASLSANIHFV
ncbi:uncharacterized protein LOC124916271 [Impatiens glandulifera]|uniref:uncharacterized protein LOC124916271 n=1 Tax=Impatiens glandulifera TaxID=253017 RepID=UPI001FB06ED5|nr:uncharacterized protein LOC124916271 [Impatiens glandulifera]